MLFYVLKRLIYTIPIGIGVSIICFALVHIGPGDPLSTLLPEDAPQEVVDRLKAEYGLVWISRWSSNTCSGWGRL